MWGREEGKIIQCADERTVFDPRATDEVEFSGQKLFLDAFEEGRIELWDIAD